MTTVKPISESDYFRLKLASTPEVERGDKHTIKKGDNLWNIAKKNLRRNASNAEISDYMYQIAKLNNINSIEEASNIKLNEEIYLPKVSAASTPTASSASAPKRAEVVTNPQPSVKPSAQKKHVQAQPVQSQPAQPQQTKPPAQDNPFLRYNPQDPYSSTWKPREEEIRVPMATEEQLRTQATQKKPQSVQPAKKVEQKKPVSKPKTNAELGFEALKNDILSTPLENMVITRGGGYGNQFNYTLNYRHPKGYEPIRIITSFVADKDGNVISISFNGKKDELSLRYDYTLYKDGKIKKYDGMECKYTIPAGSVDKNVLNQIEKILKDKVVAFNKDHHSYVD